MPETFCEKGANQSESLIELSQISKHYLLGSEKIVALQNVSLSINKGASVAITGASGSGKSTLMNIIGCLDKPSTGSYKLSGVSVESLGDKEVANIRNRKIGFIFQNFNLLPKLNALRNIMQPLMYQQISNNERLMRAEAALQSVGLSNRANHLPNQLSGGQKQRIAIARAIVTNPDLLLADEPTGNLDSENTEDILQLFESLNRDGQTLLIVTHEADVAGMCSRSVELKDGRLDQDKYRRPT